ncbi:Sucrase/ferredoxin domain-containing protein [Pleurostoma richardsiae]|uniref:Defect at low temperature protein 1 n=1 Tax=Pleurostoma richardsiae TaxID=41990 RepID=A0AA38VSN7_9PEZI|nr:Sucrase/ferredoxin domain-containing protein [Pleurostoma richardsiae]
MSITFFFRLLYGSVYTFLCFILLLLLLVTPGDVIRQALGHHQVIHVLIIGGAYIVTILIIGFVYAARLYVNRSVLASIPKSWIPVDKGDVNKDVRRMIVSSLSRSAAIAFDARPRVLPPVAPAGSVDDGTGTGDGNGGRSKAESKALKILRLKKTATVEEEMGITLPPHRPVWGEIEHNGWGSPNLPDLPNLQYSTVISELPNLIEAKALTLAPPDPESHANPPMLDPEAVALLQRGESMSLRDYLAHLHELGVLPATPAIADFVEMYEYSRYSTRPISNASFRELMRLFAEVLRSLEALDPAVLDTIEDEPAPSESDIDNDAPLATNPTTPRSQRSLASLQSEKSRAASSTASTTSSGSQVRRRRPHVSARQSSQNTWQFRTAPTTPKSRRTAVSRSSSSEHSFAQTRRAYPASQLSSGASSLRTASASGGSVIRLAERRDRTELPYVLTLTDTL